MTTTLLRPPQDFGWDVIHNNIAFLDVVTDMVEADVHMFCAFVVSWP
jgi:hypothetical protein